MCVPIPSPAQGAPETVMIACGAPPEQVVTLLLLVLLLDELLVELLDELLDELLVELLDEVQMQVVMLPSVSIAPLVSRTVGTGTVGAKVVVPCRA